MDNKNISSHKILLWQWWRGIDQQLLIAVSILIGFSLLLVTTSGGSVASRIGVYENFFASRHILYVIGSIILLVFFSCLEVNAIKKISIFLFIANILLLVVVKFYGYEVKGAKRWISIFGFSLQPSEFIKPSFCIFTGWLFSSLANRNISFLLSSGVFLLIATLLIMQPDLGMLITLTGIWGVQLFIAGLPLIWIISAFIFFCAGMMLAYKFLPHVTARIDGFLYPASHENYQVSQSLSAFKNGGFFGTGPGEGIVKNNIPDSHADFIFAVAGEEFGTVACIFISLLFAFIVIRGIVSLIKQEDEFIVLAASGILAQLAIQSIINMCVSLNLLPTKGMTLPFISYGGSSSLSVGVEIGIILALSRFKVNNIKYNILEKNDEK